MIDSSKKFVRAVGTTLAAATLVMFWSLHLAVSQAQAFA
jgi:hypothetical protein